MGDNVYGYQENTTNTVERMKVTVDSALQMDWKIIHATTRELMANSGDIFQEDQIAAFRTATISLQHYI